MKNRSNPARLAMLLVVVAPGLLAAPSTPTAVLASGDPAGGVAGATYQGFWPPAIDGGVIAFRATLTAGAGGVSSANDTGLWLLTPPDAPTLVAREGDPAPGAPTAFASFGEPVTSQGGRVAFLAKLATGPGVKGSSSTGIWTDVSGSLALVARQGSPAPGAGGATFASFLALCLPEAGGIVFAARLKGTPKSADVGVWVSDAAGHMELVERESFHVSTGSGTKQIRKLDFLPLTPLTGGDSRGFSEDGTLAMRATYSDKSKGVIVIGRSVLFEDDFDGGLSPGWTITREDPAYTTFGAQEIDLRLSAGDLFEGNNTAKNVFLRDPPTQGDFTATLRLTSFDPDPDLGFPQIDVLAYDGDDDHVRAGYASLTGSHGFELATEIGGSFGSSVTFGDAGAGVFYLRLLKVANLYFEFVSTDGFAFDYVAGPRSYGDGTPAKIGFVAMADGTESIHAHIDSLTVGETAASAVAGGDEPGDVPGAQFKTFGPPAIGASKELAFVGTLAPGGAVKKSNDSGVWNAGALIAREGDAAPGTSGTFAAFGAPLTSGAGTAVFPATLKKGAGVTAANAAGIWRQQGATSQLVARQGDAAPGAGGAVFKAITGVGAVPDGSIVFAATLAGAGVTPVNDGSVWAMDSSGVVALLLREGDPITVGATPKTIGTIAFLQPLKVLGQRRGFDEAGRLVVGVALTDGSTAIVRVDIG